MGWSAAANIGMSLYEGSQSSNAAQDAADAKATAARNAAAGVNAATTSGTAAINAAQQANIGYNQPWLTAGQGAVGQMSAGMQPGGQFTQTFTPSSLYTDPSYQWRLQQGQQSLQASAAARGGLLTGQGAKDITNYGQDAASQEYQAAYNRFMNNQNTAYSRLGNLAGMGQQTAGQLGTTGLNAASNVANLGMTGAQSAGNYMLGMGAAQAQGMIGSTNAMNSGLTGSMSSLTPQNINTAANWVGNQFGGAGSTGTLGGLGGTMQAPGTSAGGADAGILSTLMSF